MYKYIILLFFLTLTACSGGGSDNTGTSDQAGSNWDQMNWDEKNWQ